MKRGDKIHPPFHLVLCVSAQWPYVSAHSVRFACPNALVLNDASATAADDPLSCCFLMSHADQVSVERECVSAIIAVSSSFSPPISGLTTATVTIVN